MDNEGENEKVDETENFITETSDFPEGSDAPQEENSDGAVATPEENDTEGEDKPAAKPEEGEAEGDDKKGKDEVSDGDDAPAKDAPKKKRNNPQERINKVTKQREDARRESERLERENAELKAELEAKKEDTKEPVKEDFEHYDDYLTAKDEYDAKAEAAPKGDDPKEPKGDDKGGEAEFTDSEKTALALVQEAIDTAEDLPEDFVKVTQDPKLKVTLPMLEALAECDDPAKVMYDLGNNPDKAAEIAGKTPAQQMRAIAQFELSGSKADPKPKPKPKPSGGSDPITPVNGSDAQKKSLGEQSYKEFEATRNKQEQDHAKGGGW